MAMYAFAVAAGCLALIYVCLQILLSATQDAKEPPTIVTAFPFIGPILGMIKEKERFYVRLRDEHRLPIYTLRLPFHRMYIVNDTRLISPLQKHWRHVSFSAIAADAGSVVGMSNHAVDIMHQGLTTEEGFSVSWPRFIIPAMSPGRDLDAINRTAIEVIAADAERLRAKGRHCISLKKWSRQLMISATTEAVWGPENPYRDSTIREAWETFEAGFLVLSMFPAAAYLFPKLARAREVVAAAMMDYMRRGGHEKASGLVRKRYQHHVDMFGLEHDDFARGELGNTFAVLGNTVPCALWMIWHIFSDERVLNDIRDEVGALVKEDESGAKSVDLSGVRKSCPVLLSTFQEVLRFRAVNPGPRVLLDDVYLEAGDVLLKKGSMLMIPAPVQHSSVPAWGNNVGSFDHTRFAARNPRSGTDGEKNTIKKPDRVAFRAFGGGHQLCPGRHFASTEIMALAALLVLQFDIVPVSGEWVEPTWVNSPAQAGFPVPDQDIDVEMMPRDEDKIWNVTYVGCNAMMAMVAEDVGQE